MTGLVGEARTLVRERIGFEPSIGIVLGSGLGTVAEAVDGAVTVPFDDLPGFPATGVQGHAGEFVAGRLGSAPVVLQSGRYHVYEGHPLRTLAAPARTLSALGIEILIVTNAAGGISEGMDPGELMLIADHLNLTGTSPLVGRQVEGESRFPDMSEPYCLELRAAAKRVAESVGVTLREGVYAAVHGPAYETPAEVRMLARLGADAVGMSTVPEVLVARARGIRCLGFSAITNRAAGLGDGALDHEEVMAVGRLVGERLGAVVTGVVRSVYGDGK